jgi:hypothetical protein
MNLTYTTLGGRVKVKEKANFTLEQATKAQWGIEV